MELREFYSRKDSRVFYQHLLGLLGMVVESEKRPLQKDFYRARDEAGDSLWRNEDRVKT